MNSTSINIQQQAGRTGLRWLVGVGVALLIGLAFAGCASHGVFQNSGAARLSSDGKGASVLIVVIPLSSQSRDQTVNGAASVRSND